MRLPLARTGSRASRRSTPALAVGVATALLVSAPSAGAERPRYDVDLFARVPPPGKPEGIAVAPDNTIYVGSSTKGGQPGPGNPRSKVFAFRPTGALARAYTIRGQDRRNPFYGVLGMALDGHGLLYAADAAPPRMITLNPATGAQRDYVLFRDVPRCATSGRRTNCSDTASDDGSLPNFPVFAADGTMYVSDATQALIWRVPKGGDRATVWFTDARLEGPFNPNGIGFRADGRTLLVVKSSSSPGGPSGLYTLPVRADGRPGAMRLFFATAPGDIPDGFAIGRSGRIYLTLAGPTGDAVLVISPRGVQLARVPATQLQNQRMKVPFDRPANVAFLGRRALVTNHAFVFQNPDHYAVLDVFAKERGLPLFHPRVRGGSGGGGSGYDDRAERDDEEDRDDREERDDD